MLIFKGILIRHTFRVTSIRCYASWHFKEMNFYYKFENNLLLYIYKCTKNVFISYNDIKSLVYLSTLKFESFAKKIGILLKKLSTRVSINLQLFKNIFCK